MAPLPFATHEHYPEPYLDSVLADLAARLVALYGADPPPLTSVFTPQAVADGLRWDWRLHARDRGGSRWEGEHQVIGKMEYESSPSEGRSRVEVLIEYRGGTVTSTGADGAVLEQVARSRAAFAWELLFDRSRAEWAIDAVGPATELVTDVPARAVPVARCPWGAYPDRAAPSPTPRGVTATEWCTGDGHGWTARGQLSVHWHYPCQQGDSAVLEIAWPLGDARGPYNRRAYLRDTSGWMREQRWTTGTFDRDADLPSDAGSTGLTDGGWEIWIAVSDVDEAIYLHGDGRFERWPRAGERWGVTDCN
jgi:hypothetical protein